MSFAPATNWDTYRALTRDADRRWLRELSTDERYAIYADLFDTLWKARADRPLAASDQERLDRWAWSRKLEDRNRQVEAFQRRDRLSP